MAINAQDGQSMAPGWLHQHGGSTADGDAGDQVSVGQQLQVLWGSLRESGKTAVLIALVFGILLVIAATSYGQIGLNAWNQPFYDALSHKDLDAFLVQLRNFFLIAGALLVLNVCQRWLVEMLKLKLRESLVTEMLTAWMQPGRAFWLANAGQIGVNPDQRLHEDARKLCELTADLGAGLVQASILFVSFAGILWGVSSGFSFDIGGGQRAIPGFLLWAAMVYAAIGSVLSFLAGHSLIHRNAERYANEADLRSSLVWINEHIDGISLARGETDERRRLQADLRSVLLATRRLVTGLTQLTWVTAGFGWITNIAPILVAAPLYFHGQISFGGLMMAAGAFTQAQSSLRWFVDNFSAIADWRATLLRVARLRMALDGEIEESGFRSRIAFHERTEPVMHIESLQVCYARGSDRLQPARAVLEPGQRALVVCDAGTEKTLLFRALAGLWPWGRGNVGLPSGQQVDCISRGAPYLPRGSLREVLCYPREAGHFSDQTLCHALRRMGLQRLCTSLDDHRRWDRVLGQDEQMALAFARVAVHRPPWLLIDDVFGTLEDDTLMRVRQIVAQELEQTGLIHIGHAEEAGDLMFSQVWRLEREAADASEVIAEGASERSAT
jgi:putative ATP-binding cassette transporter